MFVVMEDNCTFIQKANNAEQGGATALIVIAKPQTGNIDYVLPVSKSPFDREKTPVLLINYD